MDVKIAEHIQKIEQKISKQTAKQIVDEVGNLVRNSAVLLAPADSGKLRQSISLDTDVSKVHGHNYTASATVFTNLQYATFVEYGTGIKGAMNHAGINPEHTPAYRLSPWWIHESQIDPLTAKKYHWFAIQTDDGIFYRCDGQPAQPFMYPALKDNEEAIHDIVKRTVAEALKKGK